jgi:hypothetical protein
VATREVSLIPGWPPLSVLTFIGAVVGGIWLLWSIWRSGKRRPDRRNRPR